MAGSLLEALSTATGVVDTDIAYLVLNPGGTPTDAKITVGALRSLLTGSGSTVIDFGAVAVKQKTFAVAVAGSLTTHKVIAVAARIVTGSKSADELDMDGLEIAAGVLTNGTVTFSVTANPGPVSGQFTINYILI